MTFSYTHEKGKCTAEAQDVRVTPPTLVNTLDLSASYVHTSRAYQWKRG